MKTAGGSLIAIPILTAALRFGSCWLVRAPPGNEVSHIRHKGTDEVDANALISFVPFC
jgi:hypothetical protein